MRENKMRPFWGGKRRKEAKSSRCLRSCFKGGRNCAPFSLKRDLEVGRSIPLPGNSKTYGIEYLNSIFLAYQSEICARHILGFATSKKQQQQQQKWVNISGSRKRLPFKEKWSESSPHPLSFFSFQYEIYGYGTHLNLPNIMRGKETQTHLRKPAAIANRNRPSKMEEEVWGNGFKYVRMQLAYFFWIFLLLLRRNTFPRFFCPTFPLSPPPPFKVHPIATTLTEREGGRGRVRKDGK